MENVNLIQEAAGYYYDNYYGKSCEITASGNGFFNRNQKCSVDIEYDASDFFGMLGFEAKSLEHYDTTKLFFEIHDGRISVEDAIRIGGKKVAERLADYKGIFGVIKKGVEFKLKGLSGDTMEASYGKRDKIALYPFIPLDETNSALSEQKPHNTYDGKWKVSQYTMRDTAITFNHENEKFDESSDAFTPASFLEEQPAVSAAASSMLGNMPTVQAQNPQSVHTNQSKNDNISE